MNNRCKDLMINTNYWTIRTKNFSNLPEEIPILTPTLYNVVTIPEDLPLSEPEKSILGKGLNFVPLTKKTDEFTVKEDTEKFLRRVKLKAHFHDKEQPSDEPQ